MLFRESERAAAPPGTSVGREEPQPVFFLNRTADRFIGPPLPLPSAPARGWQFLLKILLTCRGQTPALMRAPGIAGRPCVRLQLFDRRQSLTTNPLNSLPPERMSVRRNLFAVAEHRRFH